MRLLLCLFVLLSLGQEANAGTAPPTTRNKGGRSSYSPSQGLLFDWFGDRSWSIRLRGQFFIRPEYQSNRGDFKQSLEDSDFYIPTRLRLSVELRMYRSLGFKMTIQDARYWGNGLRQGGKIRFTPANQHQLHREVFLGTTLFEGYAFIDRPSGWPIRLEVGRIKLNYGYSFFLGDPGYIPQGQSFDGIRASYLSKHIRLDAMWFKIRESIVRKDTQTCTEGCFFEGDDLAGLYGSFHLTKTMNIDAYAYFLQKAPVNAEPAKPHRLGIVGFRYQVKNRNLFLGVDVLGQLGEYRSKLTYGFASLTVLRYTFSSSLKPFLGVQFMVASGDDDPSDSKHTGFIPLYSSRRKFYGLLNLFAASNIIQPVLVGGFFPHPLLRVELDFRHSWLWAKKGALLGGGNHAKFLQDTSGKGERAVGFEWDVKIIWKPYPILKVEVAAGAFLPTPGGYLYTTQSSTQGTEPAFLGYFRAWLSF